MDNVNWRKKASVLIKTELKKKDVSYIELSERLAAIGEFAAMVVHEIRHPLTIIALSLSVVERNGVAPGGKASLSTAFEEASRLDRFDNCGDRAVAPAGRSALRSRRPRQSATGPPRCSCRRSSVS